MRTTRPQMFMQIAQVVAQRSTCARLNVGAVIVKGRSIVSIGYNGAPSGALHCNEIDCDMSTACTRSTHAEMNAIQYLPGNIDIPPKKKLDIYVTDSPCVDCFNYICNWGGIDRIFFGTPYRRTDHFELAKGCGIEIYRVMPAGYIIDWATGELVDVET